MNLQAVIDSVLNEGADIGAEVLQSLVHALGNTQAAQHFFDLLNSHLEVSAQVKDQAAQIAQLNTAVTALQQGLQSLESKASPAAPPTVG